MRKEDGWFVFSTRDRSRPRAHLPRGTHLLLLRGEASPPWPRPLLLLAFSAAFKLLELALAQRVSILVLEILVVLVGQHPAGVRHLQSVRSFASPSLSLSLALSIAPLPLSVPATKRGKNRTFPRKIPASRDSFGEERKRRPSGAMVADTDVVVSYGDVVLRRRDALTLMDGEWLNDQVITFFLEYLKREAPGSGPKVEFLHASLVHLVACLPGETSKGPWFGPGRSQRTCSPKPSGSEGPIQEKPTTRTDKQSNCSLSVLFRQDRVDSVLSSLSLGRRRGAGAN